MTTSPRWFHATLAYEGTRYGGWQVQPNAVTIQQRLEEALTKLAREPIKVVGSGRTDAGVHAQGQVASFALPKWRPGAECLVPAINERLPCDIVIRHCRDACQGFHAQRQAVSKWYRYTIRNSRVTDPLQRKYHWQLGRSLDLQAMETAANFLVGELDFAAFQTLGAPRQTTVRHVSRLELSHQPAMDGQDLFIDIEANGFLYNMVRNISGTLVEIGMGRFPPERVLEMLETGLRTKGGQTAPARGLCLMTVTYPREIYDPFYHYQPGVRGEMGPGRGTKETL